MGVLGAMSQGRRAGLRLAGWGAGRQPLPSGWGAHTRTTRGLSPEFGQRRSHLFSDLEKNSPRVPAMIFETNGELFVTGGGEQWWGARLL